MINIAIRCFAQFMLYLVGVLGFLSSWWGHDVWHAVGASGHYAIAAWLVGPAPDDRDAFYKWLDAQMVAHKAELNRGK